MKTVVRRFDLEAYVCNCAQHHGMMVPSFTLEVEVDMAALARMLHRSVIHNKGRRAVEAGGRVVARVVGK